MAGKIIDMSKIKQIIRLRQGGMGLQPIAHAVGASRNTVKKYLRLIEARAYATEELLSLDDPALEALFVEPVADEALRLQALSDLFPYFDKELTRVGVTRWVLWGEYRRSHPDGYSYSRFCEYYQQWRQHKSATMHLEHSPGDKLFIDFTGKKLAITDPHTGAMTDVEVYVAVLGYSQLTYVEAVASQKKEAFIRATENALHYFGGVPKVLVPDNLKSAVHKADKYEAEPNGDFLDFANHYQAAILPARSYKPRDKALVEKAVDITYSRVFAPLRNEVFHSLGALNRAIRTLADQHNNTSFRRRPQSRRQLFDQEEKTCLTPLPVSRYEWKQSREVTVMKNGHVQIHADKHYYSVPYRFIGCKVKLIYSASEVAVWYKRERIAWHPRDLKPHGYTTVKEHMPSAHRFVSEWNPDKFINWAGAIAPVVGAYVRRILDTTPYPEQAYRSCVGILSFEKKYGRDRLVKAVERAFHYQAYSYTIIRRILQQGLDQLNFEDPHTPSLPEHDNIRGPEAYQ